MSSHSRSKSGPLRQQAGRVRAEAQVLARRAGTSARDAAGRFTEHGSEMLDKGRKSLQRAENGFEQFVAEHPFRSVVIAAGVGALLGCALRRRN
jgi:ElaB/YqjD/DUF883 family membrane-anchored ribosome-binding protein